MKIKNGSTILFQGDSITDAGRLRDFGDTPIPANEMRALGRGYAALTATRLLADFPELELKIHNRGISGNCITDMRDRWQADCLDLRPDLVSILIGVNDTWHGVAKGTPEKGVGLDMFDVELRKLLARTREQLPGVELILCEPFTTEAGAVLRLNFHPDVDERRAIVQSVAAEEGILLVPFQGMFDELCTKAPAAYWAGDGVHPTPAGHDMMARCWMETVLG